MGLGVLTWSRALGVWALPFALLLLQSELVWVDLPNWGHQYGGVLVHCDPPPAQPHCVRPPSSSDLQLQLEEVTTESQERMDAQAATIAKLNKVLQGKLQVSPPLPRTGPGQSQIGLGRDLGQQDLGDLKCEGPIGVGGHSLTPLSDPAEREGAAGCCETAGSKDAATHR